MCFIRAADILGLLFLCLGSDDTGNQNACVVQLVASIQMIRNVFFQIVNRFNLYGH